MKDFDIIISLPALGETVDYGIIYGGGLIVFIKAGAGGGIYGYRDKYLRMAVRAHETIGATVICSSNPIESPDTDRLMIERIATALGAEKTELCLVGVSDGGEVCLSLAADLPAKRLLCINPSFVSRDNLPGRLIMLPRTEKIFVFGTEDEEGRELIPILKEGYIPNFEIKMTIGADHRFTAMVDTFVDLIDLLI